MAKTQVDAKPDFVIWIDADACPRAVKEIVYKASQRLQAKVILVANSFMAIPASSLISLIQVAKGADMADFYIVQNLAPKDLVITADIPLAALVVDQKATAINPRGELYTAENVKERLSLRDFMHGLRETGVNTGGPPPFGPKDKERFAKAFDRILNQLRQS